jgi:hypothetical protein
MKYKALLLGFLLLLPMGLFATTHNAKATIMPTLAVVPLDIEFQEPCIKGTTFNVSVILWNTGLTGYDIYAFDFVLDWSPIQYWASLVNNTIVITSPWAKGSYFLVANETSPATVNAYGSYTDIHLAMTAMPPGTGLVEVNATILTMTFKIIHDVCWPNHINEAQAFCFNNVQMSSDGTHVVPITNFEADCARFEIGSVQPSMELVDKDAFMNATDFTSGKAWGTEMIVIKCMSHETDVEVHLNNVTGAFAFGFDLNFDPTVLEVDVQKVTIKSAFPPPYEYMDMEYTPTNYITETPNSGQISISVIRPSEKPGVCGADVVAVDVFLHTIDMQGPWPVYANAPSGYGYLDQDPVDFSGGMIPTPSKTWISLTDGWIMSKCTGASFGNPASPVLYGFGFPDVPSLSDSGYVPASSFVGDGTTGTNGLLYGVWLNTNPWGISGTTVSLGYLLYGDILYWFHPYKYDLNLDCVVDMQDLLVLAPYYGLTGMPGGSYADLYIGANPGVVDIFDFVAIAKHFRPVDP